jgi:hypothetical protein
MIINPVPASNEPITYIEINKWDDFPKFLKREPIGASHYLYRGQREIDWKLQSVWERWLSQPCPIGSDPTIPIRSNRELWSDSYQNILSEYLDRFKEAAIGIPGLDTKGLSERQWWAIGRHYGLMTPLLDWTRSPYVAAYFAYIQLLENLNGSGPAYLDIGHMGRFREEPVAVWRLAIDYTPFGDGVDIFRSRLDWFHRQKVQQGYFSHLTNPDFTDLETFFLARGRGGALTRIALPGRDMRRALLDLRLMNIRPSSLFPDLHGAAHDSNLSPYFEGITSHPIHPTWD